MTTNLGIVRAGKIELVEPTLLPEGTQVFVVGPVSFDVRQARRKANGWLFDYVGNMVLADQATLLSQEQRAIWRFGVFVTALSHEPRGPIGNLDVDAQTGEVLADAQAAEELIRRGEQLDATVSSPTE